MGISIYQWIVILIALWVILAPIAIIHILMSKLERKGKLLWVSIVLLLNFVGIILYLFIGLKQRARASKV
jgi:hypothetical protein